MFAFFFTIFDQTTWHLFKVFFVLFFNFQKKKQLLEQVMKRSYHLMQNPTSANDVCKMEIRDILSRYHKLQFVFNFDDDTYKNNFDEDALDVLMSVNAFGLYRLQGGLPKHPNLMALGIKSLLGDNLVRCPNFEILQEHFHKNVLRLDASKRLLYTSGVSYLHGLVVCWEARNILLQTWFPADITSICVEFL